MAKRDTIPDAGLLFIGAGRYDALKPSFDFIPGLLHDATVGILYGPPGSGKTFLAIHLLCSAALGRHVFGVTPDTREGLYVGLEGEASIKARIAAWCAQYNVAESPIDYALGRFSFATEADVENLIDHMKRRRIGFVVIDTLSLAMAGLDEISGQHMSLVIDGLHKIKRETGACVVAVAHTGKNEKAGIRGHSSQLGNVDTTIEVICHNRETVHEGKKARVVEHAITLDTLRSAVVRKQRDGEGGQQCCFTLALQDTPFKDARGATLRRPALAETDRFPELPDEEAAPVARGVDALALDVLDTLKRRNERMEIPVTRAAYRKALKHDGWRDNSKSADAWDRAFRRLMTRLDEAGLWEGNQ